MDQIAGIVHACRKWIQQPALAMAAMADEDRIHKM